MKYIIAAFAVALSSPSLALTADTPDTIYVRGQPCGSFCQNWMGISHRSAAMADHRVTHFGVPRRSSHKRPALTKVSRIEKSELRPNALQHGLAGTRLMPTSRSRPLTAADPPESSKPNDKKTQLGTAAAEIAQDERQPVPYTATEQSVASDHIELTPSRDFSDNARRVAPSEQPNDGQTTRSEVAREPQSSEPEQQTKNNEVQPEEGVTSPKVVATLSETTGSLEAAEPREAEATSSASVQPPAQNRDAASSSGSGQRVALLIARPEIETISDLNSKVVAMDNPDVPARQQIRDALSAAGVKRVDLTELPTKAIDQLIEGNVTAAVLGMVSKDAADSFPDFAGFRVFRIPLAAR